MAANWDGLVLNDYEAVMPLTWRQKLGIKYLYQPAFVQQGGIFSNSQLSGEVTNSFVAEASKQFSFAEIALNHANIVMDLPPQFIQHQRNNYILQLENYNIVSQNYEHGFRKSLRRIEKFNMRYQSSEDYSFVIELFKELYGKRLTSFSSSDYKNFKSVCALLQKQDKIITRIAFDSEQSVLAAMVLLSDGNRLYNLLSCITEIGKKFVANDFLYDKAIEEFSGKDLILDLEGSDVKGIADYYKKLSPVSQPYPFIKYNGLHPIVKLFKK